MRIVFKMDQMQWAAMINQPQKYLLTSNEE